MSRIGDKPATPRMVASSALQRPPRPFTNRPPEYPAGVRVGRAVSPLCITAEHLKLLLNNYKTGARFEGEVTHR